MRTACELAPGNSALDALMTVEMAQVTTRAENTAAGTPTDHGLVRTQGTTRPEPATNRSG